MGLDVCVHTYLKIPDNVKKGLKIIPVTYVKEVLDYALVRSLKPLPADMPVCESKEESTAIIN